MPGFQVKHSIDRLHPRATLEYRFFKVNAGPYALLVDWIDRRPVGESLLRVSVHAPGRRAVLWGAGASGELVPNHTSGDLDGVAWQLAIGNTAGWINPQPPLAPQLRLFDMSLVSAPDVIFTGWLRVDGQEVQLQQARGMLAHYWGRGLPSAWWWLSANQFDQPGVALECMLVRSRLLASPLSLSVAYLYLQTEDSRHLWFAPPARVSLSGSPDAFEITLRRDVRLVARGRDYGDLGDGIANTLTGDLEIWQSGIRLAVATGTAGLERRAAG